MRRQLANIVLVGLLAPFVASGRASAQVALVSRVPEDRAVFDQLAGMIDEPLSDRPEPSARTPDAIMRDARGAWLVRSAVVIDRTSDSVHALRSSDGTTVSRVLSAELLAQSPYAVALAIAELLAWLGATPRGTKVGAAVLPPAPPPPPPSDGAPQGPAAEALEPQPADEPGGLGRFGLALSAGVELSGSPSADLSLTRLALGLEAQLGRAQRPIWFALAARFSAPAGLERRLELALRSQVADRLEYESSELAVQLAVGLGGGVSTLAIGPFVGFSPVQVVVRDARGATTVEKDTGTGFAGVGMRLRYPFAYGFAFDLNAEAELLFEPIRYRVAGRPVIDDGPMRAQARLCLVYELAL